MSFIPKQDKTPKVRLSIQLRQDLADQAKDYAAYLDSDLDHVVEQLFLKAFRSDKDFQKTRNPDEPKSTSKAVRTRKTKAEIKPEETEEKAVA